MNVQGMDWYLEEYPNDSNRVRIVSPKGASRWFSRLQHTDDKERLEVPIAFVLEAFKKKED